MPVKCAITGEKIGSVKTNHSKVLNGEWVHTSKGTMASDSQRKLHSINNSGAGNPNYKELTDEIHELILKSIDESIEENHLRVKLLSENIKINLSEIFNKVSTVFIQNKYGSYQNLVDLYNESRETKIKYNPYIFL